MKPAGPDAIEQTARRYLESKSRDEDRQAQDLAVKIIDDMSAPEFSFLLEDESASSNETVTYLYRDNSSYPSLFDFLSELLHVSVPIEIGAVKFGPGEILVNKESKVEASKELAKAIKELQKLVHAKKADALTAPATNDDKQS